MNKIKTYLLVLLILLLSVVIGWIIYQQFFGHRAYLYVALQDYNPRLGKTEGTGLAKMDVKSWETVEEYSPPEQFQKVGPHEYVLRAVDEIRGWLYLTVEGTGIVVYDVKTQEVAYTIPVEGTITRLVLSPDGKRIFINNPKRKIGESIWMWIFDVDSREKIGMISTNIRDGHFLNLKGNYIYSAWPLLQSKEYLDAGKYKYSVDQDTYVFLIRGTENVLNNGGMIFDDLQENKIPPFIRVDDPNRGVVVKYNRKTMEPEKTLILKKYYDNFGDAQRTYPSSTMVFNNGRKLLLPITLMEKDDLRNMILPKHHLAVIDLESFELEKTHRIPDSWRGYVLVEE